MCHSITMSVFLLKKCINLANSTFNLYVIYIKLTQNTKQFRRLFLENFITVIHFLFGRKGILWAKALGLLAHGGNDILKMFSDFYIF